MKPTRLGLNVSAKAKMVTCFSCRRRFKRTMNEAWPSKCRYCGEYIHGIRNRQKAINDGGPK